MSKSSLEQFDGLRACSEELFRGQTLKDLAADSLMARLGDSLALPDADDGTDADSIAGWIVRNTRAPKDPRAVPFAFRGRTHDGFFYDYSFQKQILDDPTPLVVCKKAAQLGLSEVFARQCVALLIKHQPTNALYAFPKFEMAQAFSDTRLQPMLTRSPAIRRLMRGVDNQTLKRIGLSHLVIRGGAEYRHAQMVNADFLYVDEFDEHNLDLIESFEQRVSGSFYGLKRYFSTPTVVGYGIDHLYEQTDKKEWYDICWNCGAEVIIGEENIKKTETRLGYRWDYVCLRCDSVFEPEKRTGRWVPTAYSKRGISGYHVSHFVSPTVTAEQMVIAKQELLPGNYLNLKLGLGRKGNLTDEDFEFGRIGHHEADWKNDLGKNSVMAVDWGLPDSWAEISVLDPVTEDRVITWVECFHNHRISEHPKRMAELALSAGVRHVIADIGYGHAQAEAMRAILKDRFWTISTNSNELLDPRFDFKKRHVTWGKLACVKSHYQRLRVRKVVLPVKSPLVDHAGPNRPAHHVWVDHHKNTKIVTPKSIQVAYGAAPPEEEVIGEGPIHLTMVSAYADAFCHYLLKREEFERRQQGRGFRVRIV